MFFKTKRREMISLLFVSLAVYLAVINIGFMVPIRYVLDQFYVLWHETGHSIGAVITQGEVHNLVILPGIGGYATTAGGDLGVIYPMGYIGAALVGAFMFYISNRFPLFSDSITFFYGVAAILAGGIFWSSDMTTRAGSIGVAFLGIILLVVTRSSNLKWMIAALILPILGTILLSSVRREESTNLALFVSLVTGGILIIVALSRGEIVNLIFLNVINIALMVNAWRRVAGLSEIMHMASNDDASQYAKLMGMNPQDIAARWLIICLIIFAISLISTYRTIGNKKKRVI